MCWRVSWGGVCVAYFLLPSSTYSCGIGAPFSVCGTGVEKAEGFVVFARKNMGRTVEKEETQHALKLHYI